jgi:HEPN domain-containing protein
MRPPDEVKHDLVRRWIAKAEEDRAVTKRLPYDDPCCLAPLAYHAHQCAEKLLKAFLVQHEIEFPWTHDLDELLDLIAGVDSSLAESLRFAADLTPYSSDTRYPTDSPELTIDEVKRAVALAEKTREAILRLLPPG